LLIISNRLLRSDVDDRQHGGRARLEAAGTAHQHPAVCKLPVPEMEVLAFHSPRHPPDQNPELQARQDWAPSGLAQEEIEEASPTIFTAFAILFSLAIALLLSVAFSLVLSLAFPLTCTPPTPSPVAIAVKGAAAGQREGQGQATTTGQIAFAAQVQQGQARGQGLPVISP
jgi:hypothetical protein